MSDEKKGEEPVPAAAIIALITQVGLPAAEWLLTKAWAGENVTPDEWAQQRKKISTSFDALRPIPVGTTAGSQP